ncbi:MAG: histidine phosphatase family protein [Alphaproteobacteria bacterium]|nr:histidine phosphatase family protein [Alphaproteobacteria bacterium]
MHRLHLLRHAKASRDDDMSDKPRPLSRRGRETARRIGETLPAALDSIDLVLCSSSLRTRETAELALAAFPATPQILFEDVLYLASHRVLLRRLRLLDETIGAVLVIGHNPGLHELAVALAEPSSPLYAMLAEGKFPTSARASFTIAGPWNALAEGNVPLAAYVTPRDLGLLD